MELPEELKYTKRHEWVDVQGDIAVVGITEYAVEQLGDITLVELPEVDDITPKGDACGTIESAKAVSDFYAPVSGIVIAVNEKLEDAPEKINDDPYKDGWIARIELDDTAELDGLFDVSGYQDFLDSLID